MAPKPIGSARVNGPGRRPITSHGELERIAFALFEQHGFEATTVHAIAAAAGISRRTFFRYFETKNDVVWGDFSDQLATMRANFLACSPQQPLMETIRLVIVEFNRVDPDHVVHHRRRLELITHVPALQAHSALRFAEWRAVVAEFAAHRLGTDSTALLSQTIAHACLGTALAAYEQWIQNPALDLCETLDEGLQRLSNGFTGS